MCPTHAQLLYMDTDSAHFLLKHKQFIDNVSPMLQASFLKDEHKHFETGPKISGIWVHEGFFECGEYIGEKSYRLYNLTDEDYLTHMKGLNKQFQQQYHTQNISKLQYPIISYNYFQKSPEFVIFKTFISKNIFSSYIPIKRCFLTNVGSIPFNFN